MPRKGKTQDSGRTPDSRTKPAAPPRNGLFRSLILDLSTRRSRWRSDGTPWEPAARLARGGGADKSSLGGVAWLVGIVLVAAVAFLLLPYLSEPLMQLKPDPPTNFVAQAQDNINQSEWARGYWICARELQSRYTYGAPLPDEPPAQFHIPGENSVPPERAQHLRRMYWAQLQKAWLDPDAWETSRFSVPRWLRDW